MEIVKVNTKLKRSINKLFTTEIAYMTLTGKAKGTKLRWEAAVTGELKRKYEY